MPISREVYEAATKGWEPFVQQNANGGFSRFAYCPSCLNPIQIIGLMQESNRTPYGRHTGKTIQELGVWNQQKYEYCPFATKNAKRAICDDERVELDESGRQLYNMLRENFDVVVLFLNDLFGMWPGTGFWQRALRTYIADKAYCFPWLTGSNLPYLFAYRALQHASIYGVSFNTNTELFRILDAQPDVRFCEPDEYGRRMLRNKEGRFVNLIFLFYGFHQEVTQDDELVETVNFCVGDDHRRRTLYERKIVFDENAFWERMKRTGKHIPGYIKLAKQEMPPLD